jgi:orotate phosphoribosyltransferase
VKLAIERQGFVRAGEATIISADGRPEAWIFDIKNILLQADILEDVAHLFWEQFASEAPLQIGGMETAGIPLVTCLVLKAKELAGQDHATGFFIRKARKKYGLMKIIEGTLVPGRKIVLVDDLTNDGKSLISQIEILEAQGDYVHAVWTLLRYREESFYTYFHDKGIQVRSLFSLADFKETLGVKFTQSVTVRTTQWERIWKFQSESPSYFHVIMKSDPAIDQERVYVGSDSGIFWSLNQSDGSVAWSYQVGRDLQKKGIFSSPRVWNGRVYFGAYDGNVYCLDSKSGKREWVFDGADAVGSSPAIAPDLNMLFIGLEFLLWGRRGGIAALDLATGARIWEYHMPCFTHSTPLYIPEHQQVVIGSNDGAVYSFHAQTGKLLWKFSTGEPSDTELATGFGNRDIKASFAYDQGLDALFFGAVDGMCYSIDRKTGHDGSLFFSSVDKHLYCLDARTMAPRWKWHAGARIFASPVLIDGDIYIGANTGRVSQICAATGVELGFLSLTERVTNAVAYNARTKRFFIPTFANEVYSYIKKGESNNGPHSAT